MAIRICEACEELMQEGYSVESGTIGHVLVCNSCHTPDRYLNAEVEYHDWTQSEMDAEDFEILMNVLISDPSPAQIANVFDVLNREDASFYGPMGILDAFITYLNTYEDS